MIFADYWVFSHNVSTEYAYTNKLVDFQICLEIFKKWKTCTVFLSSYRNTSESLGEREILRQQEPQASVSTAFSSSLKLSRVFL